MVNRDLSLLHPVFADMLARTLGYLHARGLPFAIWEGYRPPDRQRYLYSKGRWGPFKTKRIVTSAKPWRSIHQYGFAADVLWWEDGQPRWRPKEDDPRKRYPWEVFHDLAEQHGLTPLRRKNGRIREAPHVQLAGISSKDLLAGRYPDGGSERWSDNLEAQILAWRGRPRAPRELPPLIVEGDRPPLRELEV